MMDILSREENHKTFLTGKDNFRYTINTEYKANRIGKPKPEHLTACRNFLIEEYKAVVVDGAEADDALGINQAEDTIIYSIDKDLLMIPGHHFNFVNNTYTEVSELDGVRAFYRQMLIGDTSDNIFGIKGIGKVKAGRIIDPINDEQSMFDIVIDMYDSAERFWMNADCLWIMQNEGETFSKRYNANK